MTVVTFLGHAAERLEERGIPADLVGLALARPTWSGPAGNARRTADATGDRLRVVSAWPCGRKCRRRRAA